MTEKEKMMAEVIRKFGFEVQETICFCKFCETVESWEDKEYADLCVKTMYIVFMDDNYISMAEREENEEY